VPETLTDVRKPDEGRNVRQLAWFAVAALAGAVLLALIVPLIQGPGRVDEVSVVNPTDYELTLSVVEGDATRRMGRVTPNGTTVLRDVVDQGDTWNVNFSTQGVDAGSVTVERDDPDGPLEIVVPDEVGELLADEGVTPALD
jgi:hypothetical protein